MRSFLQGVVAIAAPACVLSVAGHALAQSREVDKVEPAAKVEQQFQALLGRPGGLTAEQAAQRARATSNDVAARRADSAAADTRVSETALGFLPRVTAKAAYTRISDVGFQSFGNVVAAAPGTPTGPVAAGTTLENVPFGFTFPLDNYMLQGEVTVPISDYVLRLAKQYAGAKHSARAAELTAQAAEVTASSDARLQYYTWARAQLQEVVAASALDLTKQLAAEERTRLAAGRASNADVMQFEARVAERELLSSRARRGVAVAEDRLRTMLHDPPLTPYEIGEPLLADLPSVPAQNDFAALLEEAFRQRPELRALDETVAGLHADATAQRIGLLPRVDAFASGQYANPNPRYFPPPAVWHATWAVGAAVTWTSTDAILGGTHGSAASARASSAEAQARAMREGIRDDVMQAYQGVRDAETSIAASQRGLAAAEEAYRVRKSLFDADQATGTELGEAETALLRARFEAVNARIDLRVARVRLMHAVGRDVGH